MLLTVNTLDVPHVRRSKRSEIEEIGQGFWPATLSYAFMDESDVPRELKAIKLDQLDFMNGSISYFLGREHLIATSRPGMAQWRESFFAWMSRNAQQATDFYQLPPSQVGWFLNPAPFRLK